MTFITGFVIAGWSQVSNNALGFRLGGDGDINGAEVSFQHALGSANRLELDLGLAGNDNNSYMSLSGIYQWVWNIDGGLSWYAGPGANFGYHQHKNWDDHASLAVGGQIGIEYNFADKAPIQLSLDARPMWEFLGNSHDLGWGAALGIRYVW